MKHRRVLWSRFSLTTKILIVFLALSIISLAVIGSIALSNIRGVRDYALGSNTSLGESAIDDSTNALENLGAKIIKQQTIDVARQCEIYIKSHPDMTVADLQASAEFQEIAVQPVGETGYTALTDYQTLICRFHKQPEMIDLDLHTLSEKLPGFWGVMEPTQGGKISFGYYDWEDPDGSIREKYMYIMLINAQTADEVGMHMAATTYIDEFLIPVEETKDKIAAATLATSEHIDERINNMQNTFIGIFIAIILVVSGLAFWLSRIITKPIMTLKKGSEAIGSGNLDCKVEVKTGDELEDLANSFNKMASDLKEYMEELRRTTAEKERMSKELEIASGIQQSFLPESTPEIEGVDLAAFNLPAREVGGDFYDFIPISTDKWGLVIADVSGKGIPAALFMALSRTLVRANAIGNPTASEAMRRANDLIAEDDRSSMFVTLFYGVLDPKRKTLTYVNAGHNPPLVLGRGGADIIMLEAKGIALGVMLDIELEERQISLREGDIVVLYTDGVTEAINEKEEQFGRERLMQLIEEGRNLPAQELVKRIQQEVAAFSRGQPQFDDITLVILKVIQHEKQTSD